MNYIWHLCWSVHPYAIKVQLHAGSWWMKWTVGRLDSESMSAFLKMNGMRLCLHHCVLRLLKLCHGNRTTLPWEAQMKTISDSPLTCDSLCSYLSLTFTITTKRRPQMQTFLFHKHQHDELTTAFPSLLDTNYEDSRSPDVWHSQSGTSPLWVTILGCVFTARTHAGDLFNKFLEESLVSEDPWMFQLSHDGQWLDVKTSTSLLRQRQRH